MTFQHYFLTVQAAADYLRNRGFELVNRSFVNFDRSLSADIRQDRGGIVVWYGSV